MITVKVSVKNKKAADLLREVLKSLKFVDNVKYEKSDLKTKKSSQIVRLKKLLDKKRVEGIFNEINTPLDWQREQRDEWN